MRQNHIVNKNTISAWDDLYKAKRHERNNAWVFEHLHSIMTGGDVIKALEIGCGMGSFLAKMAQKYQYCSYTGIDYSPTAIERAKLRRSPTVNFKVVNVEKTVLANDKFDLVMCIETLEHVGDPEKIVKNMVRTCKDGGTLFITVPKPDTILDRNSLNWHHWTLYPKDFKTWLGDRIQWKYDDKSHLVVIAKVNKNGK